MFESSRARQMFYAHASLRGGRGTCHALALRVFLPRLCSVRFFSTLTAIKDFLRRGGKRLPQRPCRCFSLRSGLFYAHEILRIPPRMLQTIAAAPPHFTVVPWFIHGVQVCLGAFKILRPSRVIKAWIPLINSGMTTECVTGSVPPSLVLRPVFT